eukprot:TRINITY_DN37039_c0_g1_i1.p2 TRINITY_DN37039_c0_g1~~TRINITY_DN37039_c0_g1_i1.p2  ORF type:complete len:214 (+),score=57.78 TRINITY_DN37039_c0_g1_i1:72-644(+)
MAPVDDSAPEWSTGQRVVAHSLAGARKLNYMPGRIMGYNAEKDRYMVLFTCDGSQKLLKRANLDALGDTDEAVLREILTSEPATAKLRKLMQEQELGFADFEDEDLCRLVRRLLRAGYFADNPTMMEEIAADLNIAEHPRGPRAIELVRELETATDLTTALVRVGEEVNGDRELKEVFDELKARGHDFDF